MVKSVNIRIIVEATIDNIHEAHSIPDISRNTPKWFQPSVTVNISSMIDYILSIVCRLISCGFKPISMMSFHMLRVCKEFSSNGNTLSALTAQTFLERVV
jgi:hypothetical protein